MYHAITCHYSTFIYEKDGIAWKVKVMQVTVHWYLFLAFAFLLELKYNTRLISRPVRPFCKVLQQWN
jgi:hypothetical protein